MKKRSLFAMLLTTTMILSSCGSGSVKGKWSESDKQTFHKEMATVDLSKLADKKEQWVECYLEKVEANYSSFGDANKDEAGCKKLALECNAAVFDDGSVKGRWAQSNKDRYYKDMSSLDLSNLGENKQAWLDCYLEKLEANYMSYREANLDEKGCEKLAIECSSVLMQ